MRRSGGIAGVRMVHEDCQEWMRRQSEGSVDCVITSPPYNLGTPYEAYKDRRPREDYLEWLEEVFQDIHRVLGAHGQFFLNVGCSSKDPWIDTDLFYRARKHFVLQNRITWVKSIAIGGETFGHFKPINSPRFLNLTNEPVFHFTKSGSEPVDKSAVGVPYKWKSNLDKGSRARGRIVKALGYENWRDFDARATAADRKQQEEELARRLKKIGTVEDRRCRGNTWFVPYDTIKDRELDRGSHPATFPAALPGMCIRFAGCEQGSIIFDPFAGSGTTLIAAGALGMRAVGTEIDESYVAYARQRLAAEKSYAGTQPH